MGEDWFVCECGEATSDYRGGQCGNCWCHHCWDCHILFLNEYGEINDKEQQGDGMLAKCSKCDEDKKQEVKKEVKKTRKPRKVQKCCELTLGRRGLKCVEYTCHCVC